MDNKTFIRIEKLIVYLFCALSLFYLILLTIDLFQFVSNPSDYAKVYQNNTSDKEWFTNYIIYGFLYIGVCVLIFGLSIWRLFKPNKTLRVILDLIYVFVIIAVIVGYYKWYLTGFDHP
jgi:glucan phosphoethanolaminetransferase (alkaline phosphatase superfamily)